MFTVQPYRENPSTLIHCDGPSLQQGAAAAIEMASGMALIDSQPPAQDAELTPPETLALALTAAGMQGRTVNDKVGQHYDIREDTQGSLFEKLGITGGGRSRLGALAVGRAYQREFLLPHEVPQLSALRLRHRPWLLNFTPLLAEGQTYKDISARQGISLAYVHQQIRQIAGELSFAHVEKPAQVLVALGGMGSLLCDVSDPDVRRHQEAALFRAGETKTMLHEPFDENPGVVLRFTGQPMDREEPTVHEGSIDRLYYNDCIIDVNGKAPLHIDGEAVQLSSRELAAFLFGCVGLSHQETAARTAIRSKGSQAPLLNVYEKLAPEGTKTNSKRSLEACIGIAFKIGLLVSRQRPSLHGLTDLWQERLFLLAEKISEGKDDLTIDRELGLSKGITSQQLCVLRRRLDATTSGSVLLGLAHAYHPSVQSAPSGRKAVYPAA